MVSSITVTVDRNKYKFYWKIMKLDCCVSVNMRRRFVEHTLQSKINVIIYYLSDFCTLKKIQGVFYKGSLTYKWIQAQT